MNIPTELGKYFDPITIAALKEKAAPYPNVSAFILNLITRIEKLEKQVSELETRQDPDKYNG